MNISFVENSNSELLKVLFILLGIIVFLIILGIIVFPFLKRVYYQKNFKEIYFKKISNIAEADDFYLINNLKLQIKNDEIIKIDHVLFGNKYLYVIDDQYYNGAISGDVDNDNWSFYNHKGEKSLINNLIKENEEKINYLSRITKIDKSFFISIVLINGDCIVKTNANANSSSSYFVAINKLSNLVNTIEKRDINKIDEKLLKKAVDDISRLYGRGAQIE